MNNTTVQPQQDLNEFYINQIIRTCLTTLSVVAGLLGNAVVVVIILTKKTRRKNDDIFLLNLACADFLNIALETGRFVVHLSYVGGPLKKSLMWCKIFWPLLGVAFSVGIFTITAMSLHSYWVIQNPFQPKIRLLWIKLCVLTTWVIAIILLLPVTITSVNQGIGCLILGGSKEDSKAYSIALAIAQYPLPLLIILIAYIKIGVYMRRHIVPQQHSNVSKGKTLRNETRKDSIAMTKTVGAIVVLFAILLLPLQIAKVAFYSYPSWKIWMFALWDYGDVCSSLHSAINPYLYTIRSPYYRKLIRSWFQRRQHTSATLSSTQARRDPFNSLSPSCATTEVEMNAINDGRADTEAKAEREKHAYSAASGFDIKL